MSKERTENFPGRDRLIELARSLGGSVGVAGDLMVDHYLIGDVERISPEAPVPVVDHAKEEFRPGGGANVAANLLELGAVPHLYGVLGEDQTGLKFFMNLRERGYEIGGVNIHETRPTTQKTRVVSDGQIIVRIDRETREPIDSETAGYLSDALNDTEELGALSVADYDKGVFTSELARVMSDYSQERNVPVIANVKPSNLGLCNGFELVMMNLEETSEATGMKLESPEAIRSAADSVRDRLDGVNVLITAGAEGSYLLDGDREKALHIPTVTVDVYDVTGAGDTVNAVVSLALCAGATLLEAATLANFAGAVAVSKVGVSTQTTEELAEFIKERWHSFRERDAERVN